MTDAALTVLEIAAILLTLLFIAMQFAARHTDSMGVPSTVLLPAVGWVQRASLALLVAVVSSFAAATGQVETEFTVVALGAVTLALVWVTLGINHAVRELAPLLPETAESDEPREEDLGGSPEKTHVSNDTAEMEDDTS